MPIAVAVTRARQKAQVVDIPYLGLNENWFSSQCIIIYNNLLSNMPVLT
jgi:hypothetical protein